jgi:hypothetical protein
VADNVPAVTVKKDRFLGIFEGATRDGGGQLQRRWRRVLIMGDLRLRFGSNRDINVMRKV